MSRLLVAVWAATLCFAVDVSGQDAGQTTNPVTILSGCLREGRADTTTANSKGMIYTLEAKTQKLPTSPAPEGSGPIKTDARYALSFEKSVDLSRHVNHEVEVTGRILPRPAVAEASKTATAPKPLPGAAEQMFHVTELKMVSATCK